MDFLEGLLMGSLWSDTEYETRRHVGFYWLIGWIVFAAFAFLILFPAKVPDFLIMPAYLPILMFFVLALITPFACKYYYRLNIIFKFIILILLAIKFCFGFIALIQFFQSLISIDLNTAPQSLMDYINKSIADATDYFSSLGDSTGMLVGLISGGLLIVLTFAGGLLLGTVLPAVFLVIMKLIQRGIDLLAKNEIFKLLQLN